MEKKVIIVDDHPLIRKGLSQLVQNEPDLTICGEAGNIHEALKKIEELKPDLVIVDISLGQDSGIELIKDVKSRWEKMHILALSMHDESFYAERVLRAGASGYVTKGESSKTVINAIRKVLNGEIYVSEKIASKMLGSLIPGRQENRGSSVDNLTDREFEVFELIGQGLQPREIAQRLHLSVRTVNTHRENMKRKLNLSSTVELLKHAVQWVQFEREGKP